MEKHIFWKNCHKITTLTLGGISEGSRRPSLQNWNGNSRCVYSSHDVQQRVTWHGPWQKWSWKCKTLRQKETSPKPWQFNDSERSCCGPNLEHPPSCYLERLIMRGENMLLFFSRISSPSGNWVISQLCFIDFDSSALVLGKSVLETRIVLRGHSFSFVFHSLNLKSFLFCPPPPTIQKTAQPPTLPTRPHLCHLNMRSTWRWMAGPSAKTRTRCWTSPSP